MTVTQLFTVYGIFACVERYNFRWLCVCSFVSVIYYVIIYRYYDIPFSYTCAEFWTVESRLRLHSLKHEHFNVIIDAQMD